MKDYQKAIINEIGKWENERKKNPMIILEKIKAFDYGDLYQSLIKDKHQPDYSEYKSFINGLYEKYLDRVFETLSTLSGQAEESLRYKIKKFALTFDNTSSTKYSILSRLADRQAFELLLKESVNLLQTDNEAVNGVDGAPLFALVKLYGFDQFRQQIKIFLSKSYEYAILHAHITRKYDYLKDNINSDSFLVISQAIISLPQKGRDELAGVFFEAYEYASSEERAYEMNQVSGYMALYLTAFSQKIDIAILNNVLSTLGKFHGESQFIFQTRYAKWYFEQDCSTAMDFLKDTEYLNKSGHIAALLADLDCKEGLSVLEEKLDKLENPVTLEIFLEAISRLKSQQNKPDPDKRMIWMFESLSPTQRALGAESDNVFLKRAREKTKVDENVYEVDSE